MTFWCRVLTLSVNLLSCQMKSCNEKAIKRVYQQCCDADCRVNSKYRVPAFTWKRKKDCMGAPLNVIESEVISECEGGSEESCIDQITIFHHPPRAEWKSITKANPVPRVTVGSVGTGSVRRSCCLLRRRAGTSLSDGTATTVQACRYTSGDHMH